jgi:predicted small lipoprotein YifL
MRKFLVAAALLAVAACGDKGAKAPDTTGGASMAPAAMPTTVSDSSKRADSLRADSIHRADSTKAADSMAKMGMKKP